MVVIKVFPFQREIPYCFFFWLLLLLLLLLFLSATRHYKKIRDISFRYFATYIKDYLEKKNLTHRQNSIYSNRIISPFTENTVSRWTQEPSLISKIWLLEWVGVMVRMQKYQKKSFREKCHGLRVFDLFSGTFSIFATTCRRDLGHSPFILSDMLYI